MAEFNIVEQLEVDAHELRSRFKEASRRSGASSDVGDSREEAFRDWLIRYLGKEHRVIKGEAIDTAGNRSQQVDALILNDHHPPISGIFRAGPYLAEGVSWAIEVKPDLRDSREIERGLRQVASVKALKRRLAGGDITFGSGPYSTHFAERVPTFIFAEESSEIANLAVHVEEYYRAQSTAKELQVDGIVVLQQGVIYNFKEADGEFCMEVDQFPGEGILGLVAGRTESSPLAALLKLLALTHRPQLYGTNISAFYVERFTRLKELAHFNRGNRFRKG